MDYTAEQREVVELLKKQLQLGDKGQNVVVSGLGGSGKTWTMCSFICDLLEENYRILISAITGKATSVIRNKLDTMVKERGIICYPSQYKVITLTKLTKKSQIINIKETGESKFFSQWRDPVEVTKGYNVIFIDELSMVPQHVIQWCQMSGKRIFGFGDFCQLPEVASDSTFTELRQFEKDLHVNKVKYTYGYGVKALKGLSKAYLTTVLRSDNDIANLCKELRDFSISKESAVDIMKKWAEKSPDIEYSDSAKDIETGFDWQIIAYTNKKCQEVNNKLAIGKNYPNPEDKIILFDNINRLKLYNGDILKFKDFYALTRDAIKAPQNANQWLKQEDEIVIMKWQGMMPNMNSTNPFERNYAFNFDNAGERLVNSKVSREKSIIEYFDNPKAGTKAEQDLAYDKWMELRNETLSLDDRFDEFMSFLEQYGLFHLQEDIVKRLSPLPRVTIVNCDFGFACTTHRAQGSEYDKVCYLFERFDRPLLYTGLSRAKEKLKIINLTKVR